MIPGLPPYNNADEIIPGVWLGNAHASMDETFLKNAKIEVVFNCTKDLPFHQSIRRRYRVPVDDNLKPEEIRNMELWSYEIVLKMYHEYKERRPIFVHCAAGMQRSPAAIAMFLIATQGMTSEQAKAFIKQRRPIAFYPSANFGESIKGFEESINKNIVKQTL
jgi:protein tyrosine phosphatase